MPTMSSNERTPSILESTDTYKKLETAAKKAQSKLKMELTQMSEKVFSGVNAFGITESEQRTFDANMYESMRAGLIQYAMQQYNKGKKSLVEKVVVLPFKIAALGGSVVKKGVGEYLNEKTGFSAITLGLETNKLITERAANGLPAEMLYNYLGAEIAFQDTQKDLLEFEIRKSQIIGRDKYPQQSQRIQEIHRSIKVFRSLQSDLLQKLNAERLKRMNQVSLADQNTAEQFLQDELG